jgi:hypothetical protein
MTDTEVLETSEDGRYRVRLVPDEYPDEPYDDFASPLLRIEPRGGGHRAGHIQVGGRPANADDTIEGAVQYWGTCPSDSGWKLLERYLRAFHGVTQIETWYSGSYWYVTYDSAAWREWCGAPAGSASMAEYRAWCEGDCWYWITEKLVTWRAVNPVTDDPDYAEYPDRDSWETVDSCGGYYGTEWAEEAAREAYKNLITPEDPDAASADNARERLEYLRGELRGERISWGELVELQGLASYIEAGDTELLEAAGVPEHAQDDSASGPEDEPGGCAIRRTSLGGGVICAKCGPDCECTVCLPQDEQGN